MTARKMLFWCHLCLGIAVGIVVVFLALTGTLLSFQPQIIRIAERSVQAHPVPSNATCLSPSAMVARAQAQAHVKAQSVTLLSDTSAPAQMTVSNDVVYLIDPCDGSLLQPTPSASRAFFSDVKDLHRWVAVGGKKHESLRSVKDAGNLAFFVLMLLGFVLWIPRQWRAANLRSVTLVRAGLKGRAREWNLHNVAGIWFLLPLLAISLTGTIMAYPWANNALYRISGSSLPKAAEERARGGSAPDLAVIDTLIPVAKAQDTAWQSMTIRIPKVNDKNISFTINDTLDSRPQFRNLLTLSRKGDVAKWEPFAKLPRGRQWRLYARFLHSGELFGVPGQVIALFSVFAALLLVWTGFALSIRRFGAWRGRRARAAERKTVAAMA